MASAPPAYEEVNKRWKATCRVLLGCEVGELSAFEPYLTRYVERIFEKKSFLSGKPAYVSLPNFCAGARFISNDEEGKYNENPPGAALSINKIKDVDSIVEALGGRLAYAGNIVTGDSKAVEQSNSIVDSTFIYRSSDYYGSSYIAYSSNGRQDECVFGCNFTGESKFIISSHDPYKLTRCFETLRCFTSADCYYSANLEDCTDCMFSFNQRSKRNLIGNLQLAKDEYLQLKDKLVSEMAQSMRAKKSVPSIVDIICD